MFRLEGEALSCVYSYANSYVYAVTVWNGQILLIENQNLVFAQVVDNVFAKTQSFSISQRFAFTPRSMAVMQAAQGQVVVFVFTYGAIYQLQRSQIDAREYLVAQTYPLDFLLYSNKNNYNLQTSGNLLLLTVGSVQYLYELRGTLLVATGVLDDSAYANLLPGGQLLAVQQKKLLNLYQLGTPELLVPADYASK